MSTASVIPVGQQSQIKSNSNAVGGAQATSGGSASAVRGGAAAACAVPASTASTVTPPEIFPSPSVLVHAAKLALKHDKPIQMDYYVETATGKAFFGEDKDTKDKMLVKSAVEYTSYVEKMFKIGDDKIGYDFIMVTSNSIYIVSGKVEKRLIESSSLHSEENDE